MINVVEAYRKIGKMVSAKLEEVRTAILPTRPNLPLALMRVTLVPNSVTFSQGSGYAATVTFSVTPTSRDSVADLVLLEEIAKKFQSVTLQEDTIHLHFSYPQFDSTPVEESTQYSLAFNVIVNDGVQGVFTQLG